MANLRPEQLDVTTGVADNDTVTTKGYVDEHSSNDIWTRTGTDISVTNSGDDVDFNTANLIKSATFDSTNIPAYDSLPTLSDDKELAHKKYVDDHSGTGLDQLQIYYVGKAGNDSNDGKSIEHPFLTIGAAITAVTGQSPSSSNQFKIEIIDAGIYSSDLSFTIPSWCWLHGPAAEIDAAVTMLADSKYVFNRHHVPTGGVGILAVTSGLRYIKGEQTLPRTNGTFLDTANGAACHVHGDNIDMVATGAKVYSANTGSQIYFNVQKFKETAASYNDGTAAVFEDIQDKGSNVDTSIVNRTGDIVIESAGSSGEIILKSTNEIFRSVGSYPQWTNAPLVEATVSTQGINITGDGAIYTIKFDNEIIDRGNSYNPATGQFTCPVSGYYHLSQELTISGLDSSHTDGFIRIQSGGSPSSSSWRHNPYNMCNSSQGRVTIPFSVIRKLNASTVYTMTVQVDGTAKSIDVLGARWGIYLLTV